MGSADVRPLHMNAHRSKEVTQIELLTYHVVGVFPMRALAACAALIFQPGPRSAVAAEMILNSFLDVGCDHRQVLVAVLVYLRLGHAVGVFLARRGVQIVGIVPRAKPLQQRRRI